MRVYDTVQRDYRAACSRVVRVYIPSSTSFRRNPFLILLCDLVSLAARLGVGVARVVLPLVGCAIASVFHQVPAE